MEKNKEAKEVDLGTGRRGEASFSVGPAGHYSPNHQRSV